MCVLPRQLHRTHCLEGPMLGLMLCCCHLEILHVFYQQAHIFSLYLGLASMYPALLITAFLATYSTFSSECGISLSGSPFHPSYLAISLYLKVSRQETMKANKSEQCFSEQVLNWEPQS